MTNQSYRPYFTKIKPTYKQENQLNECFNVKFRAYNLYLQMQLHLYRIYKIYIRSYGIKRYKDLPKPLRNNAKKCFISAWQFRKWFNHDYIGSKEFKKNNDKWILPQYSNVPKHTLVHGFKDAYTAFFKYTHDQSKEPHFKNRHSHHSCYFDGAIHVNRLGIKLPHFNFIHFSNYGYVPTDKQLLQLHAHFKCAYVSKHADNYYISVITSLPLKSCLIPKCQLKGHLGIDVGINSEAIINALNGYKSAWFINISKSRKYQRLLVHKHVWQHRMSRRPTSYYKNQRKYNKKHIRPESKGYIYADIQYQIKCQQLSNLTKGYLRKITYQIIKRKPKSITIEHLNIRGMMQNHKLARAISMCNWGYFYKWLEWLCQKYGIELRQVSRYYPSTKICCLCHRYNHRQFSNTLRDLNIRRIYCTRYKKWIDRDLNAAINLANAKNYKILSKPVI